METKTDKISFINTVSRPPLRKCSQCGNTYFRRNLTEVWTGRNPGKRLGWHKDVAKVCLKCMDAHESKRVLAIYDVQFSTHSVLRPKKRGKK